MFERFTERARQVVVLAQEEARSPALKHNYIGTEHLLLGLLGEEEGLAADALHALGITVERVRAEVLRIVGAGEELASGQIPFTPRAKRTLERALREATRLEHNEIGTEHLLLALVGENEGVGVRILLDFDASPEKVRQAVITRLSGRGARRRPAEPVQSGPEDWGAPAVSAIDPGWSDGLAMLLGPLGAEIRSQLGRAPDLGDLLLCLACVPDTPAADALGELGIDVDKLTALIERARSEAQADEQARAQRLFEVTQANEQALEEGRFEDAAQLRDQERSLQDQAPARPGAQLTVGDELRRRLGLAAPPRP